MKLACMEMRGRSANVDSEPQECADYLARSTEYSGRGSRPEYDKGSQGRSACRPDKYAGDASEYKRGPEQDAQPMTRWCAARYSKYASLVTFITPAPALHVCRCGRFTLFNP